MSIDEFDPHLRTALRHAPDRELLPPPALSVQILEAARRAARTPAWHARWRRRIEAALQALLRPAPAAAFASVFFASLVIVLWRDAPPAETEPSARPVVPASSLPPVMPAAPAVVAQAEAPRETAADQRVRSTDSSAQAPLVPAPSRASGPRRPPTASEKPESRGDTAMNARSASPTGAAADAALAKAQPEPAVQVVPLPAAQATPQSAAQATPQSAAQVPPQPAAQAPLQSAAQAPQSIGEASADRMNTYEPSAPRAEARAATSALALAPREAELASARARGAALLADRAPADLPATLSATARTDREARWQTGTGAARAHDAQSQAWLEQLALATHGRWQRVVATAEHDALMPPTLSLHSRDRAIGRLDFDASGVRWREAAPPGTLWHAPLAPQQTARLRESLAAWVGAPDETRRR